MRDVEGRGVLAEEREEGEALNADTFKIALPLAANDLFDRPTFTCLCTIHFGLSTDIQRGLAIIFSSELRFISTGFGYHGGEFGKWGEGENVSFLRVDVVALSVLARVGSEGDEEVR